MDPLKDIILAQVLIKVDIDNEEAIELLNKRLEIIPDNTFIIYWKAKALNNFGDYKEALSQVEKAIDIQTIYYPDAVMLKRESEQAIAKQNREQ